MGRPAKWRAGWSAPRWCAALLALPGGCRGQLFNLYKSVHEFTSVDDWTWQVHDDSQAWVVSFYSLADCSIGKLSETAADRCKDDADEFAECALPLLASLGVRSGAVNVDTELGREIFLKAGVKRVPRIVGFGGESEVTDAYTRESTRGFKVYQATAFEKAGFKAWVGEVVNQYEAQVVDWVEEASAMTRPYALLFQEHSSISITLKSVGLAMRGRVDFGVVNAATGEDGVEVKEAFSVKELPALLGDTLFKGDLGSRDEVLAWFESIGSEQRLPYHDFGNEEGGPLEIAQTVQLTQMILQSEAGTILASAEDGFGGVSARLRDAEGTGVVQSALVWCGSTQKKLRSVCAAVEGGYLAYAFGKKKKRGKFFADASLALDYVASTVSAEGIDVISRESALPIDDYLLTTVTDGGPTVGFLVFSHHDDVVFNLRCVHRVLASVGVHFYQYVVDASSDEDQKLVERFQLAKAPGLVAFFSGAAVGEKTPIGVVPYSKAAMGPPSVRSLLSFASQVLEAHSPAHYEELLVELERRRRRRTTPDAGHIANNNEL